MENLPIYQLVHQWCCSYQHGTALVPDMACYSVQLQSPTHQNSDVHHSATLASLQQCSHGHSRHPLFAVFEIRTVRNSHQLQSAVSQSTECTQMSKQMEMRCNFDMLGCINSTHSFLVLPTFAKHCTNKD